MKVSDVMTKNPACATPASSLTEVAKMMVDCDCGAVPVVKDQSALEVLGVITDRDIVVRTLGEGRSPMDLTARNVMTEAAVTIDQDKSLKDAAELMQKKQIRRVVVTGAGGKVVGMLAQADLAREGKDRLTGDTVQEISEK